MIVNSSMIVIANSASLRRMLLLWISHAYFVLHIFSGIQALERSEYWRLSDEKGKPPGVLGWWPSRAVTFIENHDTGSTQVHYKIPTYTNKYYSVALSSEGYYMAA